MNDPMWFDNPAITDQMWPATIETLLMTVWSTGLAVLFGLPLGIWLFTTSKGGLSPHPIVYRVLSLIVVGLLLLFLRWTLGACKRIYKKFRLPPECAVSGAFDPDGTWRRGASPETLELEQLSENKVWYQWPRRQYARMPPPHAHRTALQHHQSHSYPHLSHLSAGTST